MIRTFPDRIEYDIYETRETVQKAAGQAYVNWAGGATSADGAYFSVPYSATPPGGGAQIMAPAVPSAVASFLPTPGALPGPVEPPGSPATELSGPPADMREDTLPSAPGGEQAKLPFDAADLVFRAHRMAADGHRMLAEAHTLFCRAVGSR